MTPSTLLRRSAALFAIGVLVAPASAAADAPPVVVKVHPASGVVSPYFSLAGRPGRAAGAGTLELINPHRRPVAVRLDPVSGITTNTLGSAYEQQNAPLTGAARWITLTSRRVTLAPHGHRVVRVGVRVPDGTAGGDYLGGVSVQALGQHEETHARGLVVGQVQRYAIGVEVKLPGARINHVDITGARLRRDPSGIVFDVLAHNDGNATLKGVKGRILITRGSHRVAKAKVTPGTFVAGTSIAYPVRAPREEPHEGAHYRVRGTLRYEGGVARIDTGVTFGHTAAVVQENFGGPKAGRPGDGFPWLIAVLAAALLGAIAGFVLFVVRKRRRGALALLRTELRAARASRPLSVVHVQLRASSRSARRRVAGLLKPRVRRADVICELGASELVVVLPDTDNEMATGLACDIALGIGPEAFGRDVRWVRAATAVEPGDPLELVARARGAGAAPEVEREREGALAGS